MAHQEQINKAVVRQWVRTKSAGQPEGFPCMIVVILVPEQTQSCCLHLHSLAADRKQGQGEIDSAIQRDR